MQPSKTSGLFVAGFSYVLLALFGVLSFYIFIKLFPKTHTVTLHSLFLPDRILTRPSREAYQLPHLPLIMPAFVPVLNFFPNSNRKSCLSEQPGLNNGQSLQQHLGISALLIQQDHIPSPSPYPSIPNLHARLPAWLSEMCWCLPHQRFFLTSGNEDKGPATFFLVGRDKEQT